MKKQFTNIEVLNQFSFASDHRLVRSTINIQKIKKSRAQYGSTVFRLKTAQDEKNYLANLKENITSVEMSEFENVESYYLKIKAAILNSIKHSRDETPENHTIITQEIKNMIKRRNELKHKTPLSKEEKVELKNLYKCIHRRIKTEYHEYRLKIIEKHLNRSGSLKKSEKELNTGKRWIPCLNTSTEKTYSRYEIINIATEFYKKLYSKRNPLRKESYASYSTQVENRATTHERLKRFTEVEVAKKLEKLKIDKSSGPDKISNEMLKVGRTLLSRPLTLLFNKILEERKIPKDWAESDIILLYKKGDPCDIGNYRPISLQPCLYKLLATCLENRLSEITENHQPVEQAGFRKNFSTTDHIHTLDQIIEKFQEFKRPLYLAFIDYVKAFDSILHESMWVALRENNVPEELVELIQDIYNKSTSRVKLDQKGPEIKICRGVRQGDPISPRIFIMVLQSIMKNLDWSKKGILIGGKFLSNLRFADDIVLFSETAQGLEAMIGGLNYESLRIGLELNTAKTKVMTNSVVKPIRVQGIQLEYVQDYIYLGKQISFKKTRHRDELERRVKIAWNKFWSYKHILKSDLPIYLKTKIMDSCLLPSLTYASQTWIFNNYTKNKIQTTQRAMERSILGLRRVHRIRNSYIRKKTKTIDALTHAMKLKWKWAGHVSRYTDKRWTKTVTEWRGPAGKRKRGRPLDSWDKEIKEIGGKNWAERALDRSTWSILEEAFTQLRDP